MYKYDQQWNISSAVEITSIIFKCVSHNISGQQYEIWKTKTKEGDLNQNNTVIW